jgi:hypothetical protein
MNKKAKFALADMDLDFIQILSGDDDLSKKLDKALKGRIAKEFFGEAPKPKRSARAGKKKEAGNE